MFGMGPTEIIFILAIALIVIGPKKLPDLAKSLGRALGEFKKATKDLKDSMGVDEAISEFKQPMKDLKDSVDLKKITKDIINKPSDKDNIDTEKKAEPEPDALKQKESEGAPEGETPLNKDLREGTYKE